MKYLEDTIRYIVAKSDFTYNLSDIITDILYDAYDTYDDNDDYDTIDALNQAIDSQLIYTDDQWNVMAYYQTPWEANYLKAIDSLLEDLEVLFRQLLEEMGKEVR